MSRPGITRNIVALGWVSMLTDVASEMLYPVIPLFITGALGASPQLLGVIEGIAEGISSGLRWIGGMLSDRYRSRKPFIVAGYAVSAASKPVMGLAAIAGGWWIFLLGRSGDRLGKSIRTAARDALIADSTDSAHRGAAFGFHRAMDTTGAVIGPLIALGLLLWNPVLPLQWLFFAAVVPGLASVLVAVLAVRDIPHQASKAAAPAIVQKYPREFLVLLAVTSLFTLGNSSDSFLILRSGELGLSTAQIILAFSLYNLIYALGSSPLGRWSDRIGRKPVMVMGWAIYAVVYLGFAGADQAWAVWPLLGMYGVYQAMTEGVTKALITDLVPRQQRAGAIGLYYTVTGFGQLLASVIAGGLWKTQWLARELNGALAFGAGCALLAAAALSLMKFPDRAQAKV